MGTKTCADTCREFCVECRMNVEKEHLRLTVTEWKTQVDYEDCLKMNGIQYSTLFCCHADLLCILLVRFTGMLHNNVKLHTRNSCFTAHHLVHEKVSNSI